MSANWPVVKLGDYCIKIGSGSTPRGGASVYLHKGEVSLIRSQNIYNDGFKTNGLVYITEESAAKLKNVIIESGDVLINITGDSVARVCMAPDKFLPARVNQHVAIIRPKPNEFDSRYIRYLLTSPTMQSYLLTIASVGATRNALTKGMIETLEVTKPPLSVQKSIADKLEALENKISINTDINQTSEQIAQAIFKSWFVDFEPVKAKIAAREALIDEHQTQSGKTPSSQEKAEVEQQAAIAAIAGAGDIIPTAQLQTLADLFPNQLIESEIGEIPEGWEVVDIKSISNKISKGTTPRKKDMQEAEDPASIKFLKVRDIADDGDIDASSLDLIPNSVHTGAIKRSILELYDVLFSIAGTIGRVSVITNELVNANCNQAVAFIRLTDPKKYRDFLYLLLKTPEVQDLVESKVVQGVQANFSLTELGNIQFAHSSDVLLEQFNKVVSSLFREKHNLRKNTATLADLRDALLPKLLSGEIDLTKKEMINA